MSAADSGFAEPGRPTPGAAETAAIPLPVGPDGRPYSSWIAGAPAERAHDSAPPVGPEPVATPAGIDPAALGPGLAEGALLGSRRRRRRPGRTRTRATVRHIDIGTAIRISAVFWLLIMVALVVASLLLWTFADAFGTLPSIDKSVRTLFSLKSFQLHPGAVAMYTAAGGVIIAVAGMLGTIVFTLIYNLIADVVGGIRVELESFSAE